MKINWKLRFKNKTVLLALVSAILTIIYQVLACFNIIPSVSQSAFMESITILLSILVTLGILVDPTTEGIYDSKTAMQYKQPK